MFGAVLIVLVTLMQAYVFWRAASVPFVRRHVSGRILLLAALALWLTFFLGRAWGHGGTGVIARTMEFVGLTWMAVLFLTTVPLLATELLTGFGFLMPRLAPRLRGLALLTGIALAVIAQVQGLRPPEVTDYEVRLRGLPRALDGTVLVALSDLHVGSQLGASWMEARVSQVRDLKPDLVVLLGDLFEGHTAPPDELLPILKGLSAPMGVWAVPGNHEFYHGAAGLSLIKTAGIRVLLNRWTEPRPGLVLAGIEDLTVWRRTGQQNDPLAEALTNRPPGATILLSHSPWGYEEAARAGVGLMLSGHTHGGQIWPFGYLVRLSYPLLAGRYTVGGMTAIVCRGTGTWGTRMRLWHTGEILRVTLRSAGETVQ